MEIVEVTFEAVNERAGLQITSDLSAGQDTVGVAPPPPLPLTVAVSPAAR